MRSAGSKGALLKPDLCVIGAGSGGLAVAAGAMALGASVVLIEKRRMGGNSLNAGVPSKILVAASRRAAAIRDAGRFGLPVMDPDIDDAAVLAHVHDVVADLARNASQARFEALGVQVVRAAARFAAPDRVEAGGTVVRARRFVIATGSTATVPPLPGLDLVRYLTGDSLVEMSALPKRLIVIGGGADGLELAQAFRRLGSHVAIVDAGPVLAAEDPELARIAASGLVRDGVVLHEHVAIERLESVADGVHVLLRGDRPGAALAGSHLLLATGRRPQIEGLGLDAGGIAYDDAGLRLGPDLRSPTNRRVYAVGDVAGGSQFAHAAAYHARLVLRAALFGQPVRIDADALPRVTYTDPEIASVGLSEEQARRRHRDIRILRRPFAENDHARIEGRTEGHVKVIATPGGAILGAGIVGAHAADLIAPWTLAIAKGLTLADMADVAMPYPTLSQASWHAAIGYRAPSLRNNPIRRILGLLRR
jgi:pyruvate/2-oxoglutarate dehydrogenase complex dihydrolipoamide dehydrogenase (E3) component